MDIFQGIEELWRTAAIHSQHDLRFRLFQQLQMPSGLAVASWNICSLSGMDEPHSICI